MKWMKRDCANILKWESQRILEVVRNYDGFVYTKKIQRKVVLDIISKSEYCIKSTCGFVYMCMYMSYETLSKFLDKNKK